MRRHRHRFETDHSTPIDAPAGVSLTRIDIRITDRPYGYRAEVVVLDLLTTGPDTPPVVTLRCRHRRYAILPETVYHRALALARLHDIEGER